MLPTLAILTPAIGKVSETFIRQHIYGLFPTQTIVVATAPEPLSSPRWGVDCPNLILAKWLHKRGPRFVKGGLTFLGLPNPTANWRISRFLRQHHVSHVLAEYIDETLPWIPMLKRLKVKWYVQAHGIDVSVALRRPGVPERCRSYIEAHGIFTRSAYQKERLVHLGLPEEKIHVNPGGVSVPSRFSEPPKGDEFRCLAVGRMVAKKAPILLLDAVRRAIQKNRSIHLDYVGAGPMLPAVQQFIRAFSLEANVKIHGDIDYVALEEVRKNTSLFVQHSITDPETGDQEGLPAAIQEAMACGVPVVSTLHAGIPEAVTDGVHGLLVAEGDTAGMAECILELAGNRSRLVQLGRAGWEKASAEYTSDAERLRILSVMGIKPFEGRVLDSNGNRRIVAH